MMYTYTETPKLHNYLEIWMLRKLGKQILYTYIQHVQPFVRFIHPVQVVISMHISCGYTNKDHPQYQADYWSTKQTKILFISINVITH